MTPEEEVIRQMLKENDAALIRHSGGHEIWRLPNNKTFPIRAESRKTGDPRGWKNTLSALKRTLAGVETRQCRTTNFMAPAPAQPERIDEPMAELGIEIKGTKRVVTELLREVRLAPHQLHGLLRKAGVAVPDDASVSHADGYTVVSWTDIQEILEDI